jgi:hypothetical protein
MRLETGKLRRSRSRGASREEPLHSWRAFAGFTSIGFAELDWPVSELELHGGRAAAGVSQSRCRSRKSRCQDNCGRLCGGPHAQRGCKRNVFNEKYFEERVKECVKLLWFAN